MLREVGERWRRCKKGGGGSDGCGVGGGCGSSGGVGGDGGGGGGGGSDGFGCKSGGGGGKESMSESPRHKTSEEQVCKSKAQSVQNGEKSVGESGGDDPQQTKSRRPEAHIAKSKIMATNMGWGNIKKS